MNASQTFLMRNHGVFWGEDMLVVWQYYGTFVKS